MGVPSVIIAYLFCIGIENIVPEWEISTHPAAASGQQTVSIKRAEAIVILSLRA
jgi:hypothetical protein